MIRGSVLVQAGAPAASVETMAMAPSAAWLRSFIAVVPRSSNVPSRPRVGRASYRKWMKARAARARDGAGRPRRRPAPGSSPAAAALAARDGRPLEAHPAGGDPPACDGGRAPARAPHVDFERRSEYSERTMTRNAADTVRDFVEAWGAMGSLWGINRSVARVHALLMASEEPLALEQIAEQLRISKGNASMSLRELRTFGVVRQVEVPGDRRDFYVTEPDVWTMFFRILRERKRREFDPALEAIRRLVDAPGATGAVRGRLEQMADLLATMDGVASRFLKDPESSRSALAFMTGVPPGSGGKSRRG